METPLQELIDRVRAGEAEAGDLVARLRRGEGADLALLLEMLRSPCEALRRAAVDASAGRTEPALREAAAALAHDLERSVRLALAEAAKDAPRWLPPSAVERL